ncbi:MAG: hypothetical protein KKF62_10845 [Bacteroidetes bacterium]|nr:hypothetical protein [Bacteroidota bacterium]MBU1116966.1 hypothetical protein [Bacteroidota bacterium]MBU1799139.1 hypothetical protein [Bacteroidota bacterium]
MKLANNQKIVLLVWIMLVLVAVASWISFGGEIFTKTGILVERQDELLGASFKEWQNKFVLGLDYTLAFIGIITLSSAIIVWWLKTKRKIEK